MKNARDLLVAASVIALLAAVAAAPAAAKKLDEAEIYIEINDTDGDAGIHIFLDGEGWDAMTLTSPGGTEFSILAENSVGFQGITEFFFESAEPSFDDQPLDELLALFPAGKYKFRGTTTEGRKLKGNARLTHNLPDAPLQLSPVDGEEVDPDDAVFTWQPVEDPPGSEIVAYEVVIECEEPEESKLTMKVGTDVTSFTAPPEFFDQEDIDECKWEVLAVEDSHNQTISETEFSLE